MFEHERNVVTLDLVNDPMCYNLVEGGDGYKIGHEVSEVIRKKMSKKAKGRKSKTKGTLLYHFGTKNKMLSPDEVEHYEKMGWQRGIYISEESRKKLSTGGFRGKCHSDESKKRMSEIKKKQVEEGKFTAWNKGTHLSDEQKQYLSNINTGRHPSEEVRKKMSVARTGKKHSEKTRQKMSVSATGHSVSPETRAKISAANKGRKRTFGKRQKYHWRLSDGTIIFMDSNNAKRLYGKNITKIDI